MIFELDGDRIVGLQHLGITGPITSHMSGQDRDRNVVCARIILELRKIAGACFLAADP